MSRNHYRNINLTRYVFVLSGCGEAISAGSPASYPNVISGLSDGFLSETCGYNGCQTCFVTTVPSFLVC